MSRTTTTYEISLVPTEQIFNTGKPESFGLSWIDIVEKRNKYFHPMGMNGWPKEPPNYIAFRYYGKLQS
ncbi:MAG: hypothetical protein L6276_01100, partial [Acetobacterium sp.]|nr:hypothetical protein [Acetobacterium sp.]